MLVELTDNWRYVFDKYKKPFRVMTVEGDLVWVIYVGIFKVQKAYNDRRVGVTLDNRCFIFKYSDYRLIEIEKPGERYMP